MQAMMLAAGLGSRLQPLTTHTPKPLIQLAGKSLIDYNLEHLAAFGITDVIVNVSYLGEQIVAHCGDGSRYGLSIRYSHELGGPLGIVGGIMHAMQHGLAGEFLLMSADCWWDMSPDHSFLTQPFSQRLLLVPRPKYRERGDFGLTDTGQLHNESQDYTYANMAFFHADTFQGCDSSDSFASVVRKIIANQGIAGQVYEGTFFNVGTLQELGDAEAYLRG